MVACPVMEMVLSGTGRRMQSRARLLIAEVNQGASKAQAVGDAVVVPCECVGNGYCAVAFLRWRCF